jgi:hypothetical protein
MCMKHYNGQLNKSSLQITVQLNTPYNIQQPNPNASLAFHFPIQSFFSGRPNK